MSIWGRVIGGAAGFALGGPIGAILGVMAGGAFDRRSKSKSSFNFNRINNNQKQQIFTLSFIILAAKLAKSDGIVSDDEIRAFKDNGTNGDNARSLSFYTGSNGGSPVERLRIQSSGHVVPGANNSYDLGSTSLGWRNVYMNDLNLSNMEGNKNDVDGTQGSWTIQEGKDDLYIINRLNGKKFKIKMEEIS